MPSVPKRHVDVVKYATKLAEKIATVPARRTGPLWAGPCGDGPLGGVTQSMLGRYLSCPERFRVYAVEGLQVADSFSAPLEFGNCWHACEEAQAKSSKWVDDSDAQAAMAEVMDEGWEGALTKYAMDLYNQHPMNREKVDHWYSMCKAMFLLYVKHWSEHDDMKQRVPLMSEQVFDVSYKLPSGRMVRLRGKFDSVDLVEGGPNAGVWLMENKTKSGIDKQKLQRQLTFDLQTMMYLIVLLDIQHDQATDTPGDAHGEWSNPIRGVRYNVIRRSAHKSVESMLKKLTEDTEAGRVEEWFARWNVDVSQRDIDKFKRECLDPVLENLCDDYEWWDWCCAAKPHSDVFSGRMRRTQKPDHYPRHFRFPYGVYSPIAEGGFGDVDAFLDSGSTAGLRRAETLFPELQ